MDFQEILTNAVNKAVMEALDKAAGAISPQGDPLARRTVTPREAAQMLGVPLPRMYQFIRRDNFPKIKNGNKYLIPIERFNDWISQEAVNG